MNDSELIWEAYIDSHYELLDESVWSTIKDIFKDLIKTLSTRGLGKEDFIYYLSLIKTRNQAMYNKLLKEIQLYAKHGIGAQKYDKVTEILLLILMNVIAFPTAMFTVTKLLPIDKVIDYMFKHHMDISQFVNEINSSVDKLISNLNN